MSHCLIGKKNDIIINFTVCLFLKKAKDLLCLNSEQKEAPACLSFQLLIECCCLNFYFLFFKI